MAAWPPKPDRSEPRRPKACPWPTSWPQVTARATAWGGPWVVARRVEGETIAPALLRDDEFAVARAVLGAQCGAALAAIHAIPVSDVTGLERRRTSSASSATCSTAWAAASGVRARAFAGWRPTGRRPTGPVGGPRRLPPRQPHRRSRRAAGRARLGAGPPRRPDRGPGLALRAGVAVRLAAAGRRVRRPRGALSPPTRPPAAGRSTPRRCAGGRCSARSSGASSASCRPPSHLSGATRSVELAAIGRRVCENEYDLLGSCSPRPAAVARSRHAAEAARRPTFHDSPDRGRAGGGGARVPRAATCAAATEGRVQFHARVAANVAGDGRARAGRSGRRMAAAHAAAPRGARLRRRRATLAGRDPGRRPRRPAGRGAALAGRRDASDDKLAVANPRLPRTAV